MNRASKILVFLMSIALLCISAYSASAQENVHTGKAFMAGLNWLGMMGWELMPYPLAYDTDGFIPQEYWLRLDVSGLSIDEINQNLSAFKNCR